MFKIDNQFANANTPKTIRFTEAMNEELLRIAKENGISFNTLVLQCCRYALDHLQEGEAEKGQGD